MKSRVCTLKFIEWDAFSFCILCALHNALLVDFQSIKWPCNEVGLIVSSSVFIRRNCFVVSSQDIVWLVFGQKETG